MMTRSSTLRHHVFFLNVGGPWGNNDTPCHRAFFCSSVTCPKDTMMKRLAPCHRGFFFVQVLEILRAMTMRSSALHCHVFFLFKC
jgi:hypothetical protein